MKYLIVLVSLIFSWSASAQTIDVKAGDHPGFTRLVLEMKQAADWRFGRTEEGYALRLARPDVRFDLASVFNDITHDRLAAIWSNPENGDLQIGIACACHAIPFEFRPGIIVIDLRDGPPPKQSSFELALDGTNPTQLPVRQKLRPRARPAIISALPLGSLVQQKTYDWLVAGRPDQSSTKETHSLSAKDPAFEVDTTGPLKEALLLQLSNGAAQGIVQMAIPSLASRSAPGPLATGPWAAIHLGDVPGIAISGQRERANELIEGGATCIPDETLDLEHWGTDEPASFQLANSRAGLIGEFDRPNPDVVIRTAKLLIYLGFGAEARQLMDQMPVEHPDNAVWASLAKMVDGAPDSGGPFAGMQTCDTAAALWATLAQPHLSHGDKPLATAVLRAFSALPAHLRRGLGPELSKKFLLLGNVAVARSIGNAAQRGSIETLPDISVMDANISLASGESAEAVARLSSVLPEAGPNTAATLIGLVDASLAQGNPIDPETAVALAALVREQIGSTSEPALRRAQILALASFGDFDQAFELLPLMPDAENDLWQLLAGSSSDAAILEHAVVPPDAKLPSLDQPVRSQIAAHLLDLGIVDAALRWLGEATEHTSSADHLLAAKAHLSNNDPDATLAQLVGLDDSAAANLRAQALWQKGKAAEAAAAWALAGNSSAELRAQSWAQNWVALANNETSSWQAASSLITSPASPGVLNAPGPLAQAQALIADSNSARATLAAFLAGVAGPSPTE